MPTYEYRCPNDHTFDLFQKMSDEPVATCPECGEEARRQLSGGAGVLFKGEGFYITDYRSEEYRKKARAEKGGGADVASDSGSDGGGADTGKPEKAGGASGSNASNASGGSGSGADGGKA